MKTRRVGTNYRMMTRCVFCGRGTKRIGVVCYQCSPRQCPPVVDHGRDARIAVYAERAASNQPLFDVVECVGSC